jgi:hypothetical protein
MPDFIPTDEEATRREFGFTGWDEHGPIFEAPEPEVASRMLVAADGNPWWPRAGRGQLAPVDGGSILDGYGAKGLWHTTETAGFPSYSTNYFPHMTVAVVDGRFQARQHIPFNRAARALRNESGGVQTNRTGVKQVEIVTRADIVDEHGLDPAMEDGLAEWATWLRAEWGVPMTCSVTFKSYPSSYGKGNGVRLGFSAWERYAGWCGHQHAPENDHGDPGALDWRRILRAEEMDEMTGDDWARLEKLLDTYMRRGVRYVDHGDETVAGASNNLENVREDIRRLATATGVRLDALENLLTTEQAGS